VRLTCESHLSATVATPQDQLPLPYQKNPQLSKIHRNGMLVARDSRSNSAPTRIHRVLSDHWLRFADIHAAQESTASCPITGSGSPTSTQLHTIHTAAPPGNAFKRSIRGFFALLQLAAVHAVAAPSTPPLPPLLVPTCRRAGSHMDAKRHGQLWLGDLPFDVLVKIKSRIVVTSACFGQHAVSCAACAATPKSAGASLLSGCPMTLCGMILRSMLVFCNVTNKIRKPTDITVAFIQEYSRVSYPLRNVSTVSTGSGSSKDTHTFVERDKC
jgi:hypothetical protein